MQYRRLGRSSVKVSEVSLGGWLTHGRSLADETTTTLVRTAFDLGVNFFDTADVYNQGAAEISLGKAIKGLRREDLFLATKCFFPMSERPNDRGLSRKHIVESVENSLRRLEIETIDLFQFHRFDPETPTEEIVRAIDDLVRQGKVIYWGVSCWSAAQIAILCAVARDWRCTLPVSNQPPYNMLNREIERDVIPTSLLNGLGQVVFSPLAQGVLTGKYRPGQAPPAGSRGADDSSNTFMGQHLTDEVLTQVAKLNEFVQGLGVSLGQFALAWCLRQSNVSSVIVGATSVEQLKENIGASGLTYTEDVWAQAEAFLES